MSKEIVKITRKQLSFSKQFEIELNGNDEEIAEAIFALVESNESVRRMFGKMCEKALIKSLFTQLDSLAI